MEQKISRLKNLLIKEAISIIHIRLELELKKFAQGKGYVHEENFMLESNPDITLFSSNYENFFMGDAKNSKNESPSVKTTVERIEKYIKEFSDLLKEKIIKGGIIAIATDNLEISKEWVVKLNELCTSYNIADTQQNPPNFKVQKTSELCYIIYW